MAELDNKNKEIDRLRDQSDEVSRIHRQTSEVNEKLIESLSEIKFSSDQKAIFEKFFTTISIVLFYIFLIILGIDKFTSYNIIPDSLHWGWLVAIAVGTVMPIVIYIQLTFSHEELRTPYEKKIQELSEQIIQYRKELETLKDNRYNSEQRTEKINEMLEEFSFLVDTYPNNREVLQFAYDIAVYNKNEEDKSTYKDSIIKLDKDEFERLQNPNYQSQRKLLSSAYKRKSSDLALFNILYIMGFFVVLGVLGFSVYTVMNNDFKSTVFTPYIFAIRVMSSITLTMIAFWGARFFNRRIHESVHLAEEYSHRATLLDMFETLKNSVDDKDHQKEILNKIITALTENPTECLNKKKADKIPTELIELAKILNPKPL